jgi:hypothetical protein
MFLAVISYIIIRLLKTVKHCPDFHFSTEIKSKKQIISQSTEPTSTVCNSTFEVMDHVMALRTVGTAGWRLSHRTVGSVATPT